MSQGQSTSALTKWIFQILLSFFTAESMLYPITGSIESQVRWALCNLIQWKMSLPIAKRRHYMVFKGRSIPTRTIYDSMTSVNCLGTVYILLDYTVSYFIVIHYNNIVIKIKFLLRKHSNYSFFLFSFF